MSPSRGGRPRRRAADPDVRKQYMGRLSPERPPLLAANVEQPAPQIRGRVRPCLSHSDGPAKAPKSRGLEIRSAGPGTSFRAGLSDKKGETIKSFDHGAWLQIYRGRCRLNTQPLQDETASTSATTQFLGRPRKETQAEREGHSMCDNVLLISCKRDFMYASCYRCRSLPRLHPLAASKGPTINLSLWEKDS